MWHCAGSIWQGIVFSQTSRSGMDERCRDGVVVAAKKGTAMIRNFWFAPAMALALTLPSIQCLAADAPDPARDKEMRDRYEQVLLRNPFQERAFNAVYEGYSKVEGVDKWVEALKPKADAGDDSLATLL